MKSTRTHFNQRSFATITGLFVCMVLTSCFQSSEPRYDRTSELQGVSFRVFSEGRQIVISAKGETLHATEHVEKGNSRVSGSEVADLNADGVPEIYVYLHSPVAHRGSLVAYSAGKESLLPIYLPGLHSFENGRHLGGYEGRDDFAVVENSLVHRFPIGSGKTRQLSYSLKKGEATWFLDLDRVVEY